MQFPKTKTCILFPKFMEIRIEKRICFTCSPAAATENCVLRIFTEPLNRETKWSIRDSNP